MADKPENLTPEESERLQALSKALQEEFANDQHQRKTIEDIKELKDDALETLRHVVRHSQSEPLRAKVAMWAYDRILDIENKDKDDALVDLIKGLPDNAQKEKETA